MRLQRFLAQAGVASRRRAEELIEAGRVKVNGRVVRELGTKVDPRRDRVDFDGSRLVAEDHVWLLLNKPDMTVSTASDPEGRQTVLDVVGSQGVRLYPVGRLDYHTEGALLLTNDGELANALMHPRNAVPRVYHVKLKGIIDPELLDDLRQGVTLDDGPAKAHQVAMVGNTGKHTWVEVQLREGRNRQIHRMMEAINTTVLRLVRVAYAGLTIEDLRSGAHRELTQEEINRLRAMVKLRGETRRDGGKRDTREKRNKPGSKGKPASRGKPGKPSRPGKPSKPGSRGKPEKRSKPGSRGKPGKPSKPQKREKRGKPRR